jgi:hypothetical protein
MVPDDDVVPYADDFVLVNFRPANPVEDEDAFMSATIVDLTNGNSEPVGTTGPKSPMERLKAKRVER